MMVNGFAPYKTILKLMHCLSDAITEDIDQKLVGFQSLANLGLLDEFRTALKHTFIRSQPIAARFSMSLDRVALHWNGKKTLLTVTNKMQHFGEKASSKSKDRSSKKC